MKTINDLFNDLNRANLNDDGPEIDLAIRRLRLRGININIEVYFGKKVTL